MTVQAVLSTHHRPGRASTIAIGDIQGDARSLDCSSTGFEES